MLSKMNTMSSFGEFVEPAYPAEITGDLRVILQIKDHFIRGYKLLEDYRRLVEDQTEFLSKDYIEDQILIGENEILQLRMEVKVFLARAMQKINQNERLTQHLIEMGYGDLETSTPTRIMYCRSPVRRAKSKYLDKDDPDLYDHKAGNSLSNTVREMIKIQNDIRIKARSIVEFYHDIYTIQLHFIMITTQICTYCMPLVTENIGLFDRIFFWSYRPELEMVRKNTEITDRLKDIYTSIQYLLNSLGDTVVFVKQRIANQKALEKVFNEKAKEQQLEQDKLLRKIHSIRQDLDLLDEENDRMVGLIVKTKPDFVNTREFQQILESMPKNFSRRYVDDYKNERPLSSPPPSKQQYYKQNNHSESLDTERPTSSLKEKLMDRTKHAFETAMKTLDDNSSHGRKNVQAFKGGIVAELSEITSDSNNINGNSKFKNGRHYKKQEEKERDESSSVTISNEADELQIRTLASIGENLRKKLDLNQIRIRKKSHKKKMKEDTDDLVIPQSPDLSANVEGSDGSQNESRSTEIKIGRIRR